MSATDPTAPVCGARKPGWENGPEIGRHRVPCVLPSDHEGEHRDALDQTWPARLPVRMCARCQRIISEPVLVREVHGNSGPGWNVYACPPCATYYPKQRDPIEIIEAVRRFRREQTKDAGR